MKTRLNPAKNICMKHAFSGAISYIKTKMAKTLDLSSSFRILQCWNFGEGSSQHAEIFTNRGWFT